MIGDASSTGKDVGATAGAAYATAEFGPEAAPIGAFVGGFVGGTVAGGVASLFGGGSAPCECQLGSCDDDDNFSITKYNILRSAADKNVAAIIDQQAVAAVAPLRAQQDGLITVDMVNRIEICLKLQGYAKAAAEHWVIPDKPNTPPAVLAARAFDEKCKADGYAGANSAGTGCQAFPKVPTRCPGGTGHSYRRYSGECVDCPGGILRTAAFGTADVVSDWFECVPDVPVKTGFSGLSTPKKATVLVGGGLALLAIGRLLMGLPVVPPVIMRKLK